MTRKRLLQNLALSVVAVVVMGVALEAGYRVYLYFRLQQFVVTSNDVIIVDQPLFQAEDGIGYRHLPDARVRYAWVSVEGDLLEEHIVTTNNAGWVSRNDYIEEKGDDEFRIVVLGDSVTANAQNSITWVDELAELLNADAELKALLGVETISVYSFAQGGTGIEQFAVVYKQEASRYNPDLTIANFIVNDVGRRFIARQSLPVQGDYGISLNCSTLNIDLNDTDGCVELATFTVTDAVWNDLERVPDIVDDVRVRRVQRLPWFSLHSEVLARVFGGRRLVLYGERDGRNEFDAELQASVAALERIEAGSPAFMALLNPSMREILDEEDRAEMVEVAERIASVPVVTMVDYLPEMTDEAVRALYHLPYDGHPNDEGLRVYAQAVYEMLVTDYWDVR